MSLAVVFEGRSTVAFVHRQGEESPLPASVAGTSALFEIKQSSWCE